MNVSKKEKRLLINSLLPQIPEAMEKAKTKRFATGDELIQAGQRKDGNGRFLVAQKRYEVTDTISVKVDHKRRISSIIDSASNFDSMTTAIANYVVKWGGSCEAGKIESRLFIQTKK